MRLRPFASGGPAACLLAVVAAGGAAAQHHGHGSEVRFAYAGGATVAEQESAPAPEWPEPPVELLILGVFHFVDAGLDSYRPQHDVDVLSPARQAEIEDILDRLAAFAPARIAVEWSPGEQARLDASYEAYREGSLELGSNEVHQLGFRLAARLGHERLYAVDAARRFYEPWVDPDAYAAAHGQMARLDPHLWQLYERQHEFDDALKTRTSLREHLLYINRPENLLRGHGQYLIGNFEVGEGDDYPGVDAKTAWYNRNLKIFANLQRIANMNGDRILLVVGAGHVPILRHAAQASPQFALVEVQQVLGGDSEGGAAERHEAHHAGQVSPYAAQEDTGIPSLSRADMDGLLQGAGMGMARPAELNQYPGPKHVLELADDLGLSQAQRVAVETIHAAMKAAAERLGAEIVERERHLGRRFAHRHVDEAALRTATAEIADLYGELRFVHLRAHLDTRAALDDRQLALYDRLRGYAAAE